MAVPQRDSLNIRRYGNEQPLPEQIPLRAGPLSLIFEAGSLRNICLGEHEILRRIYVAIRDKEWGTAPDLLSNLQIDAGADSFRIHYDVANRLGDVDFAWRGEITGDADGSIRFSMDGEARSDFLRARIGFCVLPPMTVAGHPARVTHVDGTADETFFPDAIAPQLVIDGQIKPVSPFDEMESLTFEAAPDLRARVAFEGDIFEMEDQRNWTDASYKIYSTPLRLPFPVQLHTGDRVEQAISLRLEGDVTGSSASTDAVPEITLGSRAHARLPALGLGMASHGEPLTTEDVERLRALRLDHLRLDLDLTKPDYAQRFAQACREAASLNTALEVTLFVDDHHVEALSALGPYLSELRPHIARWIIFETDGMSAPALVNRAKGILSQYEVDASIGGGTNGYFTDLNRERPDTSSMDFVVYSLNPQVHAFDNDSLMETPAAQAVTVESARRLSNDKPVVVSPVTLLPRFNPHAGEQNENVQADDLPAQVDVRQMALFGAAWTVASIKYLAESGAAAVTYFETSGWRGVMEREAGSPLPHRFPSTPGGVFPMYHVFADVAEFAEGEVLPAKSSQPRKVEALALQQGRKLRILVANLRPHAQPVTLRGLPAQVSVLSLDEASFAQAGREPVQYRAQAVPIKATEKGALKWTLPPYAVVRVDSE